MGSEKVKLMSKEGDEFEIKKDAAFLSFVIEDVFDKADPNDNEPTRLQVTSADLRQIVKWLEYHHENEETAENLKTMTPGAHSISVWDKEFFDSFQSKDEVFSLFEAGKGHCWFFIVWNDWKYKKNF